MKTIKIKLSGQCDVVLLKYAGEEEISTNLTAADVEQDDYIDELHYWTVDNQTTFPVISLATDKTEEGCKINKSLTMTYRGKQNEILKIYGEKFTIEPFNDTMFKLTKMEEENLAEEEIDLENTNNFYIKENELNFFIVKSSTRF